MQPPLPLPPPPPPSPLSPSQSWGCVKPTPSIFEHLVGGSTPPVRRAEYMGNAFFNKLYILKIHKWLFGVKVLPTDLLNILGFLKSRVFSVVVKNTLFRRYYLRIASLPLRKPFFQDTFRALLLNSLKETIVKNITYNHF